MSLNMFGTGDGCLLLIITYYCVPYSEKVNKQELFVQKIKNFIKHTACESMERNKTI